MISRLLSVCATLLTLTPATADPAPPAALASFTGVCHAYDIDEVKGVVPGLCSNVMNEIIFVDGYSSLQFTTTDATGKELRRIAFIGPRWTQVDDTHSSMVLSQLSAATLPVTQLRPTSPSGFCLFTLKSSQERHDNPSDITCEYNSGSATHLFILRHVAKAVARAATSALPQLSKGAHYSQAREKLMSLGYKGLKVPGADTCDASNETTCFPEMESCSGTGEGNCLYAWEKDGDVIEVSTVGDPPEVASVGHGQKPKP